MAALPHGACGHGVSGAVLEQVLCAAGDERHACYMELDGARHWNGFPRDDERMGAK